MSALDRPAGAQGGRCVSHAEQHERAQRGARNFRRGTAAAPGETLRMADGAAAGRARRRRSRPRGTPLGTRGEGRWARAARRAAGSRGRGDAPGSDAGAVWVRRVGWTPIWSLCSHRLSQQTQQRLHSCTRSRVGSTRLCVATASQHNVGCEPAALVQSRHPESGRHASAGVSSSASDVSALSQSSASVSPVDMALVRSV